MIRPWSIRRLLAALAALCLAASAAWAEDLRLVAWNLESGESDPAFLSKQIEKMKGVDLWGFSEVTPSAAGKFSKACAAAAGGGRTFDSFLGTTGVDDRLLIVYDASRFDLLEQKELLDLRATTGRAPLAVKLRIKSSGEEFYFMVNHLHRGSPAKRMEQTVGLRDWVKAQAVPTVQCGDYNYDVKTRGQDVGKGNPAFDKMMEGDVVRWVKHAPFVPTHKGGHKSALDFVFLGGKAKGWAATAEVVVTDDFDVDDARSTDHRPVLAALKTPGGTGGTRPKVAPPKVGPTEEMLRSRIEKRNEILRKIGDVERQLQDLRRAVRELADD